MKSVQQKIASGRLRCSQQMARDVLHLARRLAGIDDLDVLAEPGLLHRARDSRSRAAW